MLAFSFDIILAPIDQFNQCKFQYNPLGLWPLTRPQWNPPLPEVNRPPPSQPNTFQYLIGKSSKSTWFIAHKHTVDQFWLAPDRLAINWFHQRTIVAVSPNERVDIIVSKSGHVAIEKVTRLSNTDPRCCVVALGPGSGSGWG